MDLDVQQKLFEKWLGNYHSKENPWKLDNIINIGRGLIATRDIDVNELILCEPALIIGPVGSEKDDIICVICFKLISKIDVCLSCWFPMCSNCLKVDKHFIKECSFLKTLNFNGRNERPQQVIKFLTSIRGLFLNDNNKNVLNLLQCNRTSDTEKQIDDLLMSHENDNNHSLRDELVLIASVLNTNAFQVVANLSNNHSVNLKGLYPVMSLINHSCTANARYYTDSNYVTNLFARKKIKLGEEISISYSKILWSTPSRQSYLKITKQFTCKCVRCMDPTEASTFLSALKCFDRTCSGLVLPVDPIDFVSSWKCLSCLRLSEYKSILRFQEVVSCMINGISDATSIKETDEAINNRLVKVLPTSNQYIVEMKIKVISIAAKGISNYNCFN